MNLSNPNKVVTEERLNEYHKAILPYLGGMPDILANKFSRADLYSTDEKMVGRWIDGKPLYQKTIDLGALPTASGEIANKVVNHNISNVDNIFIVSGFAINSNTNGLSIPLPYVNETTNNNVKVQSDRTKIEISTRNISEFGVYNGFVTLQYTKTTDSSVEIGVDTDYSTEEKIIGTWVDGKPIYQKTFTGTVPAFTPPSDSVLEPATLNIAMDCLVDVFVSVSGFIQTVAGNYVPFPFTETTKNVTYKESSSATTLDSYSQTTTVFGRPNASTSMPNNIRVVNMNQNFNNRPLCVTAQYTKTTD